MEYCSLFREGSGVHYKTENYFPCDVRFEKPGIPPPCLCEFDEIHKATKGDLSMDEVDHPFDDLLRDDLTLLGEHPADICTPSFENFDLERENSPFPNLDLSSINLPGCDDSNDQSDFNESTNVSFDSMLSCDSSQNHQEENKPDIRFFSNDSSYTSLQSPAVGKRVCFDSLTEEEKYRRIRSQNNQASRVYRQKKKIQQHELEMEETRLKEEHDMLKGRHEGLCKLKEDMSQFIDHARTLIAYHSQRNVNRDVLSFK